MWIEAKQPIFTSEMVHTNSLFVMQRSPVYRATILKLQGLALDARNDFTFGISLNKVTVELY